MYYHQEIYFLCSTGLIYTEHVLSHLALFLYIPNMSATVNSLYSDPSAPCILGLYCSNMAIYFKANKITDSESCVAVSTYMRISVPHSRISHSFFYYNLPAYKTF